MTRHLIDTPREHDDGPRLRAFFRTERAQRPHASTLELQRRARETASETRAREYARIERRRDS